MFDLGVGLPELALIGLVALVVLGPERLPKLARTAGMWMGRARRFLSDVKRDIDQEIRSTELDSIKDLGKELRQAGDEFGNAVKDVQQDVDKSAQALTETVERPELIEALQGGAATEPAPASAPGAASAEHGKV